ncbi:hypothetical protein [Clostridium estertheticum]|uniref:Uncharacterized protein n=1 Tax=Clostridium estertheticum TaxID=238834 RepID=A0AA47EM87_9CLOT|nr:hypothetical protein [Clostridium estertheticum]MBU3154155.1 hypothetical protein [Clostridium estertheticum]WAG62834.1 hypothetical protein LL038_11615 [Clostridium estertheticum]
MIMLQKIYKLCECFEKQDRKTGIMKLINKGYSESTSIKYYNIWRRHYMDSNCKDLMVSGIYIETRRERKLLEECTFLERQRYLEALSKEQLIKITQAVLK